MSIFDKQTEAVEILGNVGSFQHCQRNFDLKKEMPLDDVNFLIDVALTTPTKQNLNTFHLLAITNREIIESIAEKAYNDNDEEIFLNSQVNCNLLFMYFINWKEYNSAVYFSRAAGDGNKAGYDHLANLEIGISIGAVGVAANHMGLRTGCCACFSPKNMKNDIFKKNKLQLRDLRLMFGIGYPQYEHHNRVTDSDNYRVTYPKRQTVKRMLIT